MPPITALNALKLLGLDGDEQEQDLQSASAPAKDNSDTPANDSDTAKPGFGSALSSPEETSSEAQPKAGETTSAPSGFGKAIPELGPYGTAMPKYVGPGKSVEAGQLIPEKDAAHDELQLQRNEIKKRKLDATSKGDLGGYGSAILQEHELNAQNPYGSAANHPGLLGKIEHGLAKVGNIAGDIVAPGAMSLIPGTDLNHAEQEEHGLGLIETGTEKNVKNAKAEASRAAAKYAGNKTPAEQTYNALMTSGPNGGPRTNPATNAPYTEVEALQASQGLGKSPEELTLHSLMTGNAGKPQINPDTKVPYTYPEAYEHVKELGQKDNPGNQPIGNTANLQAGLLRRYQVMHPKATELPSNYAIPAGANKGDYDRIDKALESEEKAYQGLQAHGDVEDDKRRAERDQSYKFNQSRLDKLRGPVDTSVARLDRLQSTLNQNSPQADALVAPELLTVMAGGQGSGLRMTEAEISRVIGGRSKWEDLKAAANKWNTDPKSATSITQEQRNEIHALVDVVGDKLRRKQGILSGADTNLIGAKSEDEHRRIVADTQAKLNRVDSGKVLMQAPNGKTKEVNADEAEHYRQLGAKEVE